MSILEHHECGEESAKTWTVRKIDAETIEKTKAAAQKSGMKIGAWVDAELKRAATRSLNSLKPAGLSDEFYGIAERIDLVANETNAEKLRKLENDMSQLFKGQHNIMILLQEIRNQQSK